VAHGGPRALGVGAPIVREIDSTEAWGDTMLPVQESAERFQWRSGSVIFHGFLLARWAATAVALTVLCLSVSACGTTVADATAAKGRGTVRVYNKPLDVVWTVVLDAVRSSDLSLVSADKETGRILARRDVRAFSWGENVAIFVEEAGTMTRTRVEIISKAALVGNVSAADWERRLFEVLDARL
jgi:hypothetical protein